MGGVPIGCILMWSGSVVNIPIYWRLCDGNNNTPNLMNRFIVGGGGDYDVDNSGGAVDKTLTESNLPSHNHLISSFNSGSAGAHWHKIRSMLRDDGNVGGSGNHYGQAHGVAADTGSYTNPGGYYPHQLITTAPNHQHNIPAHNTNDTGSGASFNILPPYYALCYIIYVG